MTRWRAVAAASLILAGSLLVFPTSGTAATIPTPIPGVKIPIPGIPSIPNCKPPPALRSSATGISAMFDGSPADTGGLPATSVYQTYGVHPFSWAVFDPGCGGEVTQPSATIDTYIGNQFLGAGTDLIALADGVHGLVVRPTWLGAFDRVEANITSTLKTHVFDVFVPLALLIVGLLIVLRSHRGAMAEAVKIAGWAVLVLAVVTVVASEPVKVGHLADQIETGGVNDVSSALAGQQQPTSSAFGTEEVEYVLMPAWERGEVGSDTSQTALLYGPRLLDGQAYKWAELVNGRPINAMTTKDKQAEFLAAASAIQKSDPGAYNQLKGQAGGRIGAGVEAFAGALATVPFQLLADLLVAAALVLLRLEVMLLPLIGVIAVFHHFRGVLTRGVLSFTIAALLNALVFSAAAAVDVLLAGFVLDPGNGIPQWFGLILSALLALILFYALKPVRRLTHMITPGELSHAMNPVADIRHAARTVTRVGVGAVTGGTSGTVAAAAGVSVAGSRSQPREAVGDQGPLPEPPEWVNSTSGSPPGDDPRSDAFPEVDPADWTALDPDVWVPESEPEMAEETG